MFSVPVLSKTMFLTLANSSKVLPPLIRIPLFTARPKPTITAVGVAKPIAQGHEITSTAIARITESERLMSKA